jgi:hypothetical protein
VRQVGLHIIVLLLALSSPGPPGAEGQEIEEMTVSSLPATDEPSAPSRACFSKGSVWPHSSLPPSNYLAWLVDGRTAHASPACIAARPAPRPTHTLTHFSYLLAFPVPPPA